MMKYILSTLVILLALGTRNAAADEPDGFFALGDSIPKTPVSVDPSLCNTGDPTFRDSIDLAKTMDTILEIDRLKQSPGARRLRAKFGDAYESVLPEVAAAASSVGVVTALSVFEAVSHAQVSSVADFIGLYRRNLAMALSRVGE